MFKYLHITFETKSSSFAKQINIFIDKLILKVHSHLVLGTLVLHPLTPY